MKFKYCFVGALAFTSFIACQQEQKSIDKNVKIDSLARVQKKADSARKAAEQRPLIQYHFEKKAVWKLKDTFEGYQHQRILAGINRVDEKHLKRLDSFLVPDKYFDTLINYMPFPVYSPSLIEVDKIIIFSYPTQAFAAYQNGKLIFTGPTNMGKKATLTPTGLFFCNWKAKEIRSSVDNDWILKWNFNVSNLGGVGFHQYDLPGYPASHSCMRLWANSAELLYNWADQWKLSKENKLIVKGTPVIIYGAYPFGKPRPWFALATNSKALDVSEQMLIDIVKPHKDKILEEQKNRNEYFAQQIDTAVHAK